MVVSVLGDPSRELAFTGENLALDSKNYHTWAYRQWVLAHFGGLGVQGTHVQAPGAAAFPALWDGELAFVDTMLDTDVRNNSAYNHRWFCVFGRAAHDPTRKDAVPAARDAEIEYAFEKIRLAPNSASAWNYARGYAAHAHQIAHGTERRQAAEHRQGACAALRVHP